MHAHTHTHTHTIIPPVVSQSDCSHGYDEYTLINTSKSDDITNEQQTDVNTSS